MTLFEIQDHNSISHILSFSNNEAHPISMNTIVQYDVYESFDNNFIKLVSCLVMNRKVPHFTNEIADAMSGIVSYK